MNVRNIAQYFVFKSGVTAPDGTEQVWDNNGTGFLEDGEVVVTDKVGKVLTTASTAKEIVIRYRKDGVVLSTMPIAIKDIKSYKVSTFRPPLEQVTTIGYNGTDGDFTSSANVLDGTNYMVTLVRTDDEFYMGVERPQTAVYITGTNNLLLQGTGAASKVEIVNGLADVIYKNFTKTTTGYNVVSVPIKVEVISDYAGGAKTAAGSAINVSYENAVFTYSGTLNAGIVVGSILSVAGKAYVVKTLDTTAKIGSFTVPYQGTTAAISSGTSATTVFLYVPIAADKWGLQITGRVRQFINGEWGYRKTSFVAQVNQYITGSIRNYGIASVAIDTKGLTTSATNVVAKNTLVTGLEAYKGNGTYEEVAQNELQNLGFQGLAKQYLVDVVRHNNRNTYSNSVCTYSVLNIEWLSQDTNSTLDTINDRGNVLIAIPVTYSVAAATMTETVATAATYGIVPVLDKLIVTDGLIGTAQTSAVAAY